MKKKQQSALDEIDRLENQVADLKSKLAIVTALLAKENRIPNYKDDESTARGNNTIPNVSIDFVVDNIGYQCDMYIDGSLSNIICRDLDFNKSQRPQVIESLVEHIDKAINTWRRKW